MLPNSRPKDSRLSPDQIDVVVEAVADSVDDAELTIDELSQAVIARAGPWAGDRVMPAFQEMWPRWRQAITTAAHRGAVCFGPNRGRHVTYTSPRRWLPGFVPDDAITAAAALLRSYLHAYGPATPAQFARWLNAPRAWASELFTSLHGEVDRVDLAGAPAWVSAGDADSPAGAPEGIRLLPCFDAYIVAGQPRELLYPARAADARWPADRQATSRYCSSTRRLPASGTTAAPAARSPSPSNHCAVSAQPGAASWKARSSGSVRSSRAHRR